MLDRYKEEGNINETNRIVNRALNNQERRFTNRIRELQIMGRDPIPKRKKDTEDTEVHNYITDILFNIGIGISLFCFLISMCIILIQNNAI